MGVVSQIDSTIAACILRPGPFPAQPGCCDWCGTVLPPRRRRWCSDACSKAIGREHYWATARKAALHRDKSACVRCGDRPLHPEVNHITPILGRHAEWGCHHHIDGLETLCHPCHVATTNEQRRNGMLTREPADAS